MKILGIETSCDETAAAVIEQLPDGSLQILSNVVASSAEMHAATGGVIPENAARQQIKSILPVIQEALKKSKLQPSDIDTIAVTIGPGLIGSLLVGVETAKTLSLLWDKPIIPVNHLVAHIYVNFLNSSPELPALALVVSGGHTDLVLMHSHNHIEWLGGTRDDAAGEAFDKTARLLDLPYPGGPNLSKLAEEHLTTNPNSKLDLFPRPMIHEDNFDWSFSGLKTSVTNYLASRQLSSIKRSEVAANIQEAIVDSLISKAKKAIIKYKPQSFLLGGGVSANSRLRHCFEEEITTLKKLKDFAHLAFHVPSPALCTDNAAAIAATAFFKNTPLPWQQISANPQLTITDKVI